MHTDADARVHNGIVTVQRHQAEGTPVCLHQARGRQVWPPSMAQLSPCLQFDHHTNSAIYATDSVQPEPFRHMHMLSGQSAAKMRNAQATAVAIDTQVNSSSNLLVGCMLRIIQGLALSCS